MLSDMQVKKSNQDPVCMRCKCCSRWCGCRDVDSLEVGFRDGNSGSWLRPRFRGGRVGWYYCVVAVGSVVVSSSSTSAVL